MSALPVLAGSGAERAAADAVLGLAASAGVSGARIFGFPGGLPGGRAEVIEAILAAAALACVDLSPGLAVGLLGIGLVSAAQRVLGGQGLGAWWPRRPSWAVLLRRPGPETRRVLYASLDRARPDRLLRQCGLVGVLLGLLAVSLPWSVRVGTAGALFVLAGVAARSPRVRPVHGGPESRAVAALVDLAREPLPDGVAVFVTSSSVEAEGVRGVLDWYGAGTPEIVWVTGAPGPRSGPWEPGSEGGPQAPALAALRRAGHRVEQWGGAPGREGAPSGALLEALRGSVWGNAAEEKRA